MFRSLQHWKSWFGETLSLMWSRKLPVLCTAIWPVPCYILPKKPMDKFVWVQWFYHWKPEIRYVDWPETRSSQPLGSKRDCHEACVEQDPFWDGLMTSREASSVTTWGSWRWSTLNKMPLISVDVEYMKWPNCQILVGHEVSRQHVN